MNEAPLQAPFYLETDPDHLPVKQSAISGGKWAVTATSVCAVVELVQLTIAGRILSPSDFGVMAIAAVIVGLASSYIGMGMNLSLIQRQDVSTHQLSSLYWFNLFSGCFLCLLVIVLSLPLGSFFHEPRLSLLLKALAPVTIIISASAPYLFMLEKELRFDLLAKQDICKTVVAAVVVVISAANGQGVWSLVWGELVRWLLSTVLLLWSGWPRWPILFHFEWRDIQSYFGFGLYQIGENTILTMNSRVDRLLVGALLGTEALGYYNFAFKQILDSIYQLNPLVTRIALPVFARLQHDPLHLRGSFLKASLLLNNLNAPVFFGLAAVAPVLVPVAFGEQWIPSVLLVQIVSLYGFLRASSELAGCMLLSLGKAGISFRRHLALSVAVVPFITIGAKLGGTTGVGVALVFLMLCYFAATYFFIVRRLFGPCHAQYILAGLKPALLAAMAAGGMTLLVYLGSLTLPWLLAELCAGILLYGALLWFTDRKIVTEIKNMLRWA